MKNLISTLFILFLMVPVLAQVDEEVPEETPEIILEEVEEAEDKEIVDTLEQDIDITVTIGRRDFNMNDNLTTSWFNLGLGFNTVLNQGNFNLPSQPQFFEDWNLRMGNSTNVNLGIVQQKLNVIDHKINLVYGLNLDFNKFSYENDFFIDTESASWSTNAITQDVKKNRLAVKYVQIPVMINFESNKGHHSKSFRLNAGGFAGMRIGSNQKVKFESDFNGNKKVKTRDDFNLENFQYGLRGEVGFSTYQLNDMFENQTAEELRGLNIGVMVVPF